MSFVVEKKCSECIYNVVCAYQEDFPTGVATDCKFYQKKTKADPIEVFICFAAFAIAALVGLGIWKLLELIF